MGVTELREILRMMAYQRARGELLSILFAYYNDGDKYAHESSVIRSCVAELDALFV